MKKKKKKKKEKKKKKIKPHLLQSQAFHNRLQQKNMKLFWIFRSEEVRKKNSVCIKEQTVFFIYYLFPSSHCSSLFGTSASTTNQKPFFFLTALRCSWCNFRCFFVLSLLYSLFYSPISYQLIFKNVMFYANKINIMWQKQPLSTHMFPNH